MMTQLSGCMHSSDRIILDPSLLCFRITVRHPFHRWVKLEVVFEEKPCYFGIFELSVSEGFCQPSEISWRDVTLSLTVLRRRTGKLCVSVTLRLCNVCPGTTANRGLGLPRNTGQRLSVTSVRTSSQQSAVINCKTGEFG